jgi:hypothetical protein
MVYMLVRSPHIFFFALKRYFELIFGYLVEQILNSGSLFSLTILTLFARIVVLELYNFSNNLQNLVSYCFNSSVGFTRLNR